MSRSPWKVRRATRRSRGIDVHILFLTDNFPPESNAPASRTFEHCVRWVRAGARVTVITGAPNFPEGRLFEGYRNRWYAVEHIEAIRVIRVKTYIAANEGFGRRTLDYLSFMVSSFIAGLWQRRVDVIVGTSPQFFTVCSAWMLSLFRRRPFVFELRDLWPASIRVVGAMGQSRWLSALEHLELFLYRRANRIVAVTGAFRRELAARGIDASKIVVVPNGVDLARFVPRERDPLLAREYGFEGRFVVGYIGTQGLAHALDNVLDAAAILNDEPDIVFLLAGSGARHDALVEEARARRLDNVIFLPRQPKSAMPAVWSLCDVSLIHLKNVPLFASVIPSKIFESMGMGLPMIVAVPPGEATGIVEDTGSGVAVAPGDPAALADAIRALRDDGERRARLARSSRDAATRYSRDRLADAMLKDLREAASSRAAFRAANPADAAISVNRSSGSGR